MGYEGSDFDEISAGVSPAFVETLYRAIPAPSDSVEPGWRGYFEGLEAGGVGPELGNAPTGRRATPTTLTAGARPDPDGARAQAGQGRPRPPRRAAPAAARRRQDGRSQRRLDSIRAMMLIRTYRVRGHLAANLDPLGLATQRAAGRSQPRISRLHRSRHRSPDLSRRHAGPRMRDGARDRRHPARAITAAMSASNICTSPTSRSAASSRSGWRARTRRSASRPRARRRS